MPTFPTVRPLARILSFGAAVALLAACKGLTAIDASYQNVTTIDTVYALTGGPPNSLNAIKFFEQLPTRADQGFGFDVAFDIAANGNVRVIPARALATSFANPYSVGLQPVSGPFETILEAPKEGYHADTSQVIPVGQTLVAESRDVAGICLYALKGQSYYSKLVVTEVDPGTRRIVFTVTINRNCGFRSFAPGIPQN